MSNTHHPECWTTSDVCMWLRERGLGIYVDQFKRHRIDGEALLLLTERDLKEDLQMSVLGDVKRLGAAINRLARAGMHDHLDFHNSVSMSASSLAAHSSQHLKHPTLSTLSSTPLHTRSRNYSSDSQASDLPEQPRLGNLRRANGVATQLRPEYFRTAISFLYVLLVTWITAFVMVFVHDRVPDKERHPPLPDIFLDNVPHISWAFQLCEITIITLASVWFGILFFHKHRSIACRRFCALSGSVLLLRCATMFITSLSVPGSHLECAPRIQSDTWTKMSQAYLIWRGGGLSLMGVRTCGDYMFSGHTATLTLLNFFITEYTPRRVYYLHIFSWVLNMFGIFFILAAHEHYSIDVFIAFYITSRMFLYYHSLANNRALQQRDSFRTKIWFPMFSYFEAHIDGIVPNEYSNPLATGKFIKLVKTLFLWSNITPKKEKSN